MSLVSRGRKLAHFQASALWEWPATERASHTFRSGKNEVMRILVFWKRRAKLSRALNKRAGKTLAALGRIGIGLFDCPHDQGTDGGTGFLRPIPQPVVQWFRNITCGADGHAIIMS